MSKNKFILFVMLFSSHTCFSQTTPITQFRGTVTKNISTPTLASDNLEKKYYQYNFNKAKNTHAIEKSDMDSLLLYNYISSNQVLRDSVLIRLRTDSLANARNDDSVSLNRINNKIRNIQIYNTNEFLSQLKKPIKPFAIHRIRYFDIDTLNKYWYNQPKVSSLQSASVNNFSNSNTTVSAELVSALFGPVRAGFSGSFTTQQDSNRNNAIKASLQKIITNGGAININLLAPLIYCRDRRDQVHFGIYAQSIWSINPGINDSTGNTNFSNNVLFNNQSGFLFHLDVGSNDFKTRFSFDIPYFYTWGSKQSYSQLGVADYSLIKLQFGLIVGDLINLNISGPLLSTNKTIQKTPFNFSIQFSPSQVIKSNTGS